MNQLYVVPTSVLHSPIPGYGGVVYHNLFHRGYTGIPLDGGMELVCVKDFASDMDEKTFHARPEVARLQHPTMQASTTLKELTNIPAKKFHEKHIDALKSLGVDETATVWKIHSAAIKRNPGVGLITSTY